MGTAMPTYSVNTAAVDHAKRLIDARQYVLTSEWGQVQPSAQQETDYLEIGTRGRSTPPGSWG